MSNDTKKRIKKIFVPSLLSGFVSVAVGLIVAFGTIVMIRLNDIGISHTLFAATVGSGSPYQSIATNLSKYPVINYLPLYLFWAGVGTIVYFLAIHAYKAFADVVNLENQLNYVNVRRRELIKQALLHVLFRLVALIVWIIFIEFSLHTALPYCLFELHNAAGHLHPQNILIALGIAGLLALDLAVHIVLLRFLFLKTRLFGEPI